MRSQLPKFRQTNWHQPQSCVSRHSEHSREQLWGVKTSRGDILPLRCWTSCPTCSTSWWRRCWREAATPPSGASPSWSGWSETICRDPTFYIWFSNNVLLPLLTGEPLLLLQFCPHLLPIPVSTEVCLTTQCQCSWWWWIWMPTRSTSWLGWTWILVHGHGERWRQILR